MSTANLTKSPFTTTAGKLITLDVANKLIEGHKTGKKILTVVDSYYFDKDQIQNLLDQYGAAGIRIHFGVDDEGNQKLIIFPASENGINIFVKNEEGFDTGLDFGLPCPPICGHGDPTGN